MGDCSSGSKNCNFTCPKGGSWFVCPDAPYFVGCCSSDPCNSKNPSKPCPDVYPASFKQDIFDRIRPNTCVNNASQHWYSCSETKPTFLGCCKSDPCKQGSCPDEDLIPAAWSSTSLGQKRLFLDGAGDAPPDPSGSSGLSAGAIAGIAIGAAAVVILAIIAAVLFWRRRRRSRDSHAGSQRMNHHSGQFYHPVSQYGDSQYSSSPGNQHSKHRASSSIGSSAFPSPTFFTESRPMSEVYASSRSEDYTHLGHGLNIQGANTGPLLSPKVVAVPELDSTPKEVHELEGR